MNRFVISCDFIEDVGANTIPCENWTDVLLVFAQSNSKQIFIDNELILFSKYREMGEHYELIRVWLDIIARCKKEVFCQCSSMRAIKKKDDLNALCIDLAGMTPGKRLITSRKDTYLRYKRKVEKKGINVIDGSQAKELLEKPIEIIINQESNGNYSPNTITFNT